MLRLSDVKTETYGVDGLHSLRLREEPWRVDVVAVRLERVAQLVGLSLWGVRLVF